MPIAALKQRYKYIMNLAYDILVACIFY